MRVDVQKVLFVGHESARGDFFEKAQELGIVEFLDKNGSHPVETPAHLQSLANAIKVVNGLPVMEQEEVDDLTRGAAVADEILALKHKEEALREERRMLRQEVARVEVFGDFNPEDLAVLKAEGNREIQFFCSKKGKAEEAVDEPGLVYIGSGHGLDYFLSVQDHDASYEGMIEMRIERPLSELVARQGDVEEEIQEVDRALNTYARFDDLLRRSLIAEYNGHHLTAAKAYADEPLESTVFAVEGWVPVEKSGELDELLETTGVHCELIAVEEEDREPTCLENEGLSRVGEDLVHIYDTPATSDKDPSAWVLWSFALFFAIILSDGGYGVLFLVLALFLRFKFPNAAGMGKRMIRLSTILSVSCIGWGLLTNSFFGLSLPVDHPTKIVSVLDHLVEMKAEYHFGREDIVAQEWLQKFPGLSGLSRGSEIVASASEQVAGDTVYPIANEFRDNIMLELALLIGVVHVALGFCRYLLKNPTGLGWLAFLIGGYLYVPSYLDATSLTQFVFGIDRDVAAQAGHHLLIGGFGLAILIGVISDGVMGILEIANVVQVFADVLSYLRLYALGLAGGIVSATVNDMAGSVPVVFGLLILLAGHTVNIALSLMGGVIHGLRLNFIEWYHYCFDGGGKLFEPLRLMKTD